MLTSENLRNRWSEFSNSPRAKQLQKWFRRIVVMLIVSVIGYQLYDIGWREVITSLPTQPLFYTLFFLLYLTLPTSEVFIYKQVWRLRRWPMFKAFLTKRVYNEEVMGYSGEFYLFLWARKYLSDSDKEILKHVRDNNILSSVTSNLVAVLLIGTLITAGVIDLSDLIGNVNMLYIVLGLFLMVIVVSVLVQFRKYIFSLPFRKAVIVFSIYLFRFMLHHGLLIVQWSVVLPDTPVSVWFLFVAIIIMVNRIPFLPSRDLIFMWAGIEVSKVFEMATASVAAMLLVSSAMKKITNLILFLIISYYSDADHLEELKKEQQASAQEPK
ncbi:MAG: hypothetical protein EA360_10945 [Balneolaceae bacterium]|nr:MAG: hypothetical protein EA360_10945 [Balneolaceae bacterium]